jgi:hypothetical protein
MSSCRSPLQDAADLEPMTIHLPGIRARSCSERLDTEGQIGELPFLAG